MDNAQLLKCVPFTYQKIFFGDRYIILAFHERSPKIFLRYKVSSPTDDIQITDMIKYL